MYLANVDFDALIREDVPYFDLTGFELGLDDQETTIACFTREHCTVCGTEEAREVFRRLGIETTMIRPSGTTAEPGEELIAGRGPASSVLTAWKVVQNLIDHTTGMATKARRMVDAVHAANPEMAVLTTRKMFSGTKALSMKAVMAGGAMPHRLGISETILIFSQHIGLLGGEEELLRRLPSMKRACCEKKILAETNDLDFALRLLRSGADGIQLEKLTPDQVTETANAIRAEFPNAVLLAAGGINESNAAAYAATPVDGLVTTSLYTAKPTDVGVKIKPVEATE